MPPIRRFIQDDPIVSSSYQRVTMRFRKMFLRFATDVWNSENHHSVGLQQTTGILERL